MESELYLRHVLEEKGFMIGSEMDGASRKGRLTKSDRLDSDYWARFETIIRERDLTDFGSREKKQESVFVSMFQSTLINQWL